MIGKQTWLFVMMIYLLTNFASGQSAVKLTYRENLGVEFGLDLVRASLNHMPWLELGSDHAPMKIGDIGKPYISGHDTARLEVVQVVDESNIIVKNAVEWFWIKNVDSSNFRDDQELFIKNTMKYTGNKQYQTVLGATKTVQQLEPFVLPEPMRDLQVQLSNAKKKQNAKDLRIQWWFGNDNTRTLARYLAFDKGELTLQQMDGTEIKVKSKDLAAKSRTAASRLRTKLKKEKKDVETPDKNK